MSFSPPWSPVSRARVKYAELRPGEGGLNDRDDPMHPDFMPMEERSEAEKTRFFFRQQRKSKKIAEFD